jgi:hypothetical protein
VAGDLRSDSLTAFDAAFRATYLVRQGVVVAIKDAEEGSLPLE